jgi:hypothetical protein
MSLTRIHADFNRTIPGPVLQEPIAVTLDTFGSLRDLSNAGIKLRECALETRPSATMSN